MLRWTEALRRPSRRSSTLVLALLLAACSQAPEGGGAEPAVRVRTAEVTQRTLAETVRGIGTLRALQTVEVRPEVAGRITGIAFEEGDRVNESDLLFELDARKLEQELAARQAALRAARARLENAERELNRIERLYGQRVATEDARDQAATDLRAATAEVQRLQSERSLARERLADTRIEAPFTGHIAESTVDVGDFVQAGDLLATVYRTDELEIEFTLPERHSGRIETGQHVDLTVAAYPQRRFVATTTFVSPSVNDETRDFLVKARLENPQALLKPGTFATAELTVDQRSDALVVPEEALIATREGYMVFVVAEDGTAEHREVAIGLRSPGVAQVVEGLSLGERVVRTGHMRVAAGSPLEVVANDRDQAPGAAP